MRTTTATTRVAICALFLASAATADAQGLPTATPFSVARNSDASAVPASSVAASRVALAPSGGAPSGNVISARDLAVPEKAAREFRRSMKAFGAGDLPAMVGHLQKAIRIAPDFVQARNNLGAAYIRMRDYQDAVPQLQRAVELDPNLEESYNNLGMALLQLRRFPEAEDAARHALDLAPGRTSVSFTLGRVLAMEDPGDPQAADLLARATSDFPQARLCLAEVLVRRGSVDQAMAELQAYLATPAPAKREMVEAWLVQLSRQPRTQKPADTVSQP